MGSRTLGKSQKPLYNGDERTPCYITPNTTPMEPLERSKMARGRGCLGGKGVIYMPPFSTRRDLEWGCRKRRKNEEARRNSDLDILVGCRRERPVLAGKLGEWTWDGGKLRELSAYTDGIRTV